MMDFCYRCMRQLNGARRCVCGFENSTYKPVGYMLWPGSMLQKRYTVGAYIGEGGFGITYIGWDSLLARKVAIKEFYLSGYATRNCTVTNDISCVTGDKHVTYVKYLNQFLEEGKILAKFEREDGIVHILDFFRENNTAYIIMEYLEGETLKEYVTRKGNLSYEKCMKIMFPVMRALESIHQRKYVHRDISPDNIMLLNNGKIKLLDFGAAREFSFDETKTMSVMLKKGFAPEEQYRTKGKQGPWSDVYSLAATMYFCLTGRTPVNSVERLIEDRIVSVFDLVPSVGKEHSDVIMTGLAVMRQDRYETINEFRSALVSGSDIEIPRDNTRDSVDFFNTPEAEATLRNYGNVLLGLSGIGIATIIGMVVYFVISLFI